MTYQEYLRAIIEQAQYSIVNSIEENENRIDQAITSIVALTLDLIRENYFEGSPLHNRLIGEIRDKIQEKEASSE